MRIREAEDGDLRRLAEIQVAGREWFAGRYEPETLGAFPAPVEPVVETIEHLRATGTVLVAGDPDPVGFASAIVRDGVWFLSQLWVDVARHGEGIGSALLDAALAWGRGASVFSVVASSYPGAQTLYLRRSMFPLWVQRVYEGDPGPVDVPAGVRPLAEDDQPWIDALEREVRGLARSEDHALFRREARGLVLERESGPAGFCYVWEGGKVGPAAVADGRDTPALLRAALAEASRPVGLMIPDPNWAALAEMARLGMRLVGHTTFMASRRLGDGGRYISAGGALG